MKSYTRFLVIAGLVLAAVATAGAADRDRGDRRADRNRPALGAAQGYRERDFRRDRGYRVAPYRAYRRHRDWDSGVRVYVRPYSSWGWYGYSPFWSPWYPWGPWYRWDYYYRDYPVIQVPSSPPVYIEKPAGESPAPGSGGQWYHCSNPEGYYPYVKQCAAGWQAVPSRPADLPAAHSPEPATAKPAYTWYYCDQAKAYYPYVKTCPSGWRPVTPTEEP